MAFATTTARPRLLYVVNEDFAFLLNRLPMARAARAAGYEVHVATRVDKGATAIEAEGFTLHRIPFRRGGLSPFAAVPTIAALRRLESKIRPQIVHHSGLQCCVYGSIAALGRKIPLVNAITGLGYIFTSVTWRTRLLKRSMAILLPWLFNRKQSVVLVQNPDDLSALESLGIEHGRTILIPGSGVDTDVLQPLPEPTGPITMGFAGRLLTDKGIRALVAAHGILREQGHDINLIIAGNPDPANPASVQIEEAWEWSQRPGITWLGHIENIVSLWRRCHFAVLPSHREGLPMSLLEAAACGRAMIATDAPGCREVVIHDQTGVLVPIEEPLALAAAILGLAKSSQLRDRYGQAARKLVVEKLSAKIIGNSVVELYDELTRNRHQHRAPDGSILPSPLVQSTGKILLVSQHYAPFPSTTSAYMTEIAEELARDCDVTVLSGSPGSNSKAPPKSSFPTIIEIKSWWPGKSALVSRSLAAVLFALQVFFAILKHARREDAILCVTTPFTVPYAVTVAARLRKIPAALIIHDFYPDTLVMAGILHPRSIVTKIMRWANSVLFKWLDAVVTIGRDMNVLLMAYPRMQPSKIVFIPNWPTLPIQHRVVTENSFRVRCGSKFLVAMSGNAGFTHDPNSVFEAARILENNTDIHFLFSGEGVGWTTLKKRQAATPLRNVTLIERVPEAELEEFLSAADIWIIPYRKNNTGVSVPSRIYNLLAVGRPVIICSEPDAEAALLVQEHDLGWVVQPEDPAAIARTVELAASAAGNTQEKGRRATEIARSYARPTALNSYRQLMRRLLNKHATVSDDL
ncbi:glycosyltransferase [Bradyrhizobium sp. JYMT SZCCT0428]|uniref:glycosyltransferase n=1 Tax=Bradyrhizobium sp. JYMT SZCCT0428 TaxID=2807673 RepID=UPI00289BF312|nr:glycosyltransferase [Bradyrhizobium sp. JYMT SZCCT0428]